MENEQQWVDETEEALYVMMQQCPLTREFSELHAAIRKAESVAFNMLPASRQEYLLKSQVLKL
jgi:hypothetical protein